MYTCTVSDIRHSYMILSLSLSLSHVTLVGVPRTPHILYTWSMVPDPGNNGRVVYTSDMIQAMAHISMGEL